MSNGNTALQLLEPPSAPEQRLAPDSCGIDLEILGQAVARGTCSVAAAIEHGRANAGRLDSEIKENNAIAIAAVVALQLDYVGGDSDFISKAHEFGKVALRRHFPDDLFQRHSPAEVDAALDFHIDSLLMVVSHVVKDERIYRVAWAN